MGLWISAISILSRLCSYIKLHQQVVALTGWICWVNWFFNGFAFTNDPSDSFHRQAGDLAFSVTVFSVGSLWMWRPFSNQRINDQRLVNLYKSLAIGFNGCYTASPRFYFQLGEELWHGWQEILIRGGLLASDVMFWFLGQAVVVRELW